MSQSIASSEFCKTKANLNNYFICNVCRLCANVSDNVVPIFDKINEKGSIYTKLKKCLPSILVLENDTKPKQICLSCVSKLDLCVSFIDMSMDADFKFESLLQSKFPQIQIVNDQFLNNKLSITSQDLSWLQIKQEPIWADIKQCDIQNNRHEQKQSNSFESDLSVQLCQQKSFQEQLVVEQSASTSTQFHLQTDENLSVLINKQNNIIQNLVMQEGISSQDLIVLVELKSKDHSSVGNLYLTNKKTEVTQSDINENSIKTSLMDELTDVSSKTMDTNSNVRIINLTDLDGKLDQFGKTASVVVNENCTLDKNVSDATGSTILKAFEADLFNVLKLDNLNADNTNALSLVQKSVVPDYEGLPVEVPSSIINVTLEETAKKTAQQPFRDLSCNICGRQFTRRNRLNAHVARHSSERPHSCDKCDQRFITRWDLTLHLRIHSGVFSCEYCGKAFPAKGKLERHRRTHTGERPFPCHKCSKAFSEKRNLENHLKTHAAADARKNTLILSNIYLSCGHLGSITGNGQLKTCDLCQREKSNTVLNTGYSVHKQSFTNVNNVSKNIIVNQMNNDDTNNNDSNTEAIGTSDGCF